MLPPRIVEPISVAARSVRVQGCLPGVKVRVFGDGGLIGAAVAAGAQCDVPLDVPLQPGATLTVIASSADQTSPGTTPVKVLNIAMQWLKGHALQVSPVPPGARAVAFAGAIPGATLHVYLPGGLLVGEGDAHGGCVTIATEAGLVPGTWVVQGTKSAGGQFAALSLPQNIQVSGLAVAPGDLTEPVVQFRAGATTARVSGLTPGATVRAKWIKTDGAAKASSAKVLSSLVTKKACGNDSFEIAKPKGKSGQFEPGQWKLQVWQQFGDVTGPVAKVYPGKPGVPSPRVWSRLRAGRTSVVVDHLVAGATLEITVKREAKTFTSIAGVWEWGHAEFALPAEAGPLQVWDVVTFRQKLGSTWCETSPGVTVWNSELQPNRLRFLAQPIEGAVGVAVSAHPGALLTVTSQRYGGIIGRMVVDRYEQFLEVAPALVGNDTLTLSETFVKQVLDDPLQKAKDRVAIVEPLSWLAMPKLVDIGVRGLQVGARVGTAIDLAMAGVPIGSRFASGVPFARIDSPRALVKGQSIECATRTSKTASAVAKFTCEDKAKRGFWYDIGGPEVAEVLGLHAALLPTGKILLLGGHENSQEKWDKGVLTEVRSFDCDTHEVTYVDGPSYPGTGNKDKNGDLIDLFCCGHAMLASGKLLLAGGTERPPGTYSPKAFHHAAGHQPGSHDSWLFDPWKKTFAPTGPLSEFPNSQFLLPPELLDKEWIEACKKKLGLEGKSENAADPKQKLSEAELAAIEKCKQTDLVDFKKAAPQHVGGRWYPTILELPAGGAIALGGHPGSTDVRHNNWSVEEFAAAGTPSDSTWVPIAGKDWETFIPKWLAANPDGTPVTKADKKTTYDEGSAGYMYPRAFIGTASENNLPWIYSYYWINKKIKRFLPTSKDSAADLGQTAPQNANLDMWSGEKLLTVNLAAKNQSRYGPQPVAKDFKPVPAWQHLTDWFGSDHTFATVLPLPGAIVAGTDQESVRVLFGGAMIAVLYDGATGTFYQTQRPELDGPRAKPANRFRANATWLPSNEMVVTGGIDGAIDTDHEFGKVNKLYAHFYDLDYYDKDKNPVEKPLIGGIQDVDAIRSVELYVPPPPGQPLSESNASKLGEWRVGAAAREPRNYHNVALLMPNGAVLVASSNRDGASTSDSANLSLEVYEPWYFWRARPKIVDTGTNAEIKIGQGFAWRCTATPGTKFTHAVLHRCNSVTHGYSADARTVVVDVHVSVEANGQEQEVAFKAIANPVIAIPGWYLAFVVASDNVPSIGVFIEVAA